MNEPTLLERLSAWLERMLFQRRRKQPQSWNPMDTGAPPWKWRKP